MQKNAVTDAKEDTEKLEQLLDKGVLGHIKKFFRDNNITTYEDFLDVEQKEFGDSIEKFDKRKIDFMIDNEIPLAIRPTTILNILYETGKIDSVKSKICQKLCEKVVREEIL